MTAKILLADDSNVAQRMGKEILSAEGFEVVTVSNGHAALKKVKESLPDLILADVFMPGNSGYEVCEAVKSETRSSHVPVVLLVGAMEPYDPEEGHRVKADGVIVKPLQSSKLMSMVKELLAAAQTTAPAGAAAEGTGSREQGTDKTSAAAPPQSDSVEPDAEQPQPSSASAEVPRELAEEPVAAFADFMEAGADSGLEPESLPRASQPVEFSSGDQPSFSEAAAAPEPQVSEAIEPAPLEEAQPEILEAIEPPAPLPWEIVPHEPEGAVATAAGESGTERWQEALGVSHEEANGESLGQPSGFAAFPWDLPPSPAETIATATTDAETGIESETVPWNLSTEIPAATAEESFAIPRIPEGSVAEPPSPAPRMIWTAEPAEVTPEDQKAFEDALPNWDALAKMVEAEIVAEVGSASFFSAKSAPVAAAVTVAEEEAVENAADLPWAAESEAELPTLDAAAIEQLVRQTVEDMMPEIVGRIAQALGVSRDYPRPLDS